MSDVRLASSAEGPDGAPAVILANPTGTTRELAAVAPVMGMLPGPVTAAICAYLAAS
jgi:hypothetical protein